MSRKIREETGERLRRGRSQDGGNVSVAHARNTANFLSPDASHGSTSLERVPSLNRLHAQSSTETSGLGETVTSGFSSQESVHSYVGDDKERDGGGASLWERSRKRGDGGGGSSPSGVRQARNYEHVDTEAFQGGYILHYPHFQLPTQQTGPKYVTFSTAPRGQGPIGKNTSNDVKSSALQVYGHSDSGQANHTRHYRDTGGRSLTPQQAKEEQNAHRKASLNNVPDRRKAGSGSIVLESQTLCRPDTLERKSIVESIELQDRSFSSRERSFSSRERSSSTGSSYPECDVRKRVRSSSGSYESSTAEPDRGDQRQSVSGAKTERSFVLVGRSSSNSKDCVFVTHASCRGPSKDHAPSVTVSRHNSRPAAIKDSDTSVPAVVRRPNRSKPRDPDDSIFRTNVKLSSKENVPTVGNVRSCAARENVQANLNVSVRHNVESVNREKLASDLDVRVREKRARSREQSRSQSSSSRTNSDEHHESSGSKKSCDTVRLNKSQESKLNFEGETVLSNARKAKKDSISNDHYSSPSNLVSVEPSTRQKLVSEITEGDHEFLRNSETIRDSTTGQESFLLRRKVPQEEQRVQNTKLQRIESRVPYERQRNEPLAERRQGDDVKNKQSPQRFSEPSQNVPSITKPAEESTQFVGHSSSEKFRDTKQDGAKRPDGELNTIKSNFKGLDKIKDERLFLDFIPVNIKETFSRLSSKIGESLFSSEKAQHSQIADDSSVSKTERQNFSQSIEKDKSTQRASLRASGGDDKYSVYDAEDVKSDVEDDSSNMDYDRFFHQASRGVNGTGGGGGGYRGYPAVLDGGYSSPSLRRQARGQFGLHQNNIAGNFVHTTGIRQGLDVTRNGPTVIGQEIPTQNTKSVPYTKFQVPTTPMGPIPTVQLIASPDVPGFNIDAIHKEWERRGSKTSIRSHNSNKSSKFLGVTTESAWTKWSRDRRASYRRRLEKMERSEALDSEVVRVSTPVKKARQEGLKFVHPDLEARYLSEDDLNELRRHKQQQVHVMRVIERSRKNKFNMKTEVKLSAEQWHALQEFWEHHVFIRARYLGVAISVLALIFMLISIVNNDWLTHGTLNMTIVEGLWVNCTYTTVTSVTSCKLSNGRNWQNAVIGFMIFAATFGFLASVLSMCGVCTNPLPRKVYYFHSAGEIFLISALSTIIALLVFLVEIEKDTTIKDHRYGVGYGMGWGGALLFLAAAVCMSLDDIVRQSTRTKCSRWCWKGKGNARNQLRQV